MVDHPIEQTGLMTIEEFVRLYETEGPFELVNGERVPLSPAVAGHGDKARKIHDAFAEHNRQHNTGISYFEMPYVLAYTPNWVKDSRVPDVMFYRMERITAYKSEDPDWEDKPFVLVPDLVVEVISRNDKYTVVNARVDRYLEDGVQIVWVFDPKPKTIIVRTLDSYSKFTVKDTLTGGNVIPGFEIAVKAIFE
jgi:Uma2 family endonuclease